jgi:large subunit ribosomal protein L24
MKIKKGDKIEVIAGDDKGTKGTVLKAFPLLNKVLVEGVNIVKKHQKSRVSGAKGTIVEKPLPIHASNVKKI